MAGILRLPRGWTTFRSRSPGSRALRLVSAFLECPAYLGVDISTGSNARFLRTSCKIYTQAMLVYVQRGCIRLSEPRLLSSIPIRIVSLSLDRVSSRRRHLTGAFALPSIYRPQKFTLKSASPVQRLIHFRIEPQTTTRSNALILCRICSGVGGTVRRNCIRLSGTRHASRRVLQVVSSSSLKLQNIMVTKITN